MTAYDEARAAGLAALHADSEWHRSDGAGVWRANYGRAVDLIIAAVLPHLTDDGATAPTAFLPSATEANSTAAPSSPHLREILAAIDGERGYMDNWAGRARNDALTDAREAVEKLFQDRPATPAIDREALATAAHKHFCVMPGEPTHEPDEIDYDKADEILEILALIGAPNSGASEDDR